MTKPPRAVANDVEALLAQAAEHHRAGRPSAAEPLYRDALRHDPRNWRANHNLALIHLSRGEAEAALPLLALAMETEAPGAETWLAYARALTNAGQFEDAERLIAGHGADPRSRALEIRLRQVWGMAAVEARAFREAERQFRKVLSLAPDEAHSHGDLGYALLAKGEAAAAEPHLRRAAELARDDPDIRLNLGSALYRLDHFEEAQAEYWRAVRLAPQNAAAVNNLGQLLAETGAGEEALALADLAKAHHRRLSALIRADALLNLGRYAAAAETLEPLLATRPDDAPAIYRRAYARLATGDFEGGWRDYEVRWRIPEFAQRAAPKVKPPITPHLDLTATAAELTGRRVLLVAEQGVGDQLMFASIVPDMARAADHVALVCDERLVNLFRVSFPGVEVTGPEAAKVSLRDFDKVISLGGLGRIWRNRVEEFPGTPYLKVVDEARARWGQRLGPKTAPLRIGLSWRGGTKFTGAARRSLTLEQLAPILDLPGCESVSLQYGDVAAELAGFNAGRDRPIRAFPAQETNDFAELAALVANLDAVVSIQTALVHLCGAIGQECLTLLPFPPEWRFGVRGERMPWYGSVRLLRQDEPGHWDNVIASVADDLSARIG